MKKTDYNSKEYLEHLRHSAAHLLAAAVMELYPDAKRTIGPAIESGFYFDFDFGKTKISDEDLPKIEKRMHEIAKTWKSFERISASKQFNELIKQFSNNPYKLELMAEIKDKNEEMTSYKSGDYFDLCRGGHIDHP